MDLKIKNYKIKNLAIFTALVLLGCFRFWSLAEATEYYESGTLVSKNLLISQYVNSIDSLGYNATIPANTSLKVQFSQNKTSWYSSAGVLNAWDTLSDGDYLSAGDAIDLSGLNWSESFFFYKVSLTTTDTSTTGVLSEIRVYFDEGEAPATSYETSGTLVSKNILSGVEVDNVINGFYYNASSIPAATSLRVQFSQDKTTWYNSAGEANGWDTLAQGSHLIDLTNLGWSGLNFYYKIEFSGNGNGTPVLDEVKVDYVPASASDYPDPVRFSQNVTFSVEWLSILDSGVKLYVCKAEDGTSSGCGVGGEWCSNSDDFETGKTITCPYQTAEGDVGSNNYYVYVCDSSSNCSSAIPGTFTVQSATSASTKLKGGIKLKGGTKFK
ncbi:hypothetical protein AMJ47_04080 [Parcubacteria bacterium DG_72]|nr:MAG: hypothetical protein AMJ47_04080 [Parcubacteria bacterium DG_72]